MHNGQEDGHVGNEHPVEVDQDRGDVVDGETGNKRVESESNNSGELNEVARNRSGQREEEKRRLLKTLNRLREQLKEDREDLLAYVKTS